MTTIHPTTSVASAVRVPATGTGAAIETSHPSPAEWLVADPDCRTPSSATDRHRSSVVAVSHVAAPPPAISKTGPTGPRRPRKGVIECPSSAACCSPVKEGHCSSLRCLTGSPVTLIVHLSSGRPRPLERMGSSKPPPPTTSSAVRSGPFDGQWPFERIGRIGPQIRLPTGDDARSLRRPTYKERLLVARLSSGRITSDGHNCAPAPPSPLFMQPNPHRRTPSAASWGGVAFHPNDESLS